jgi:glycosyltransferase involved in cell wall biosynthesis
MKILQVSASDVAGGAERSAKNLAKAYEGLGHQSWLAVGLKREHDPNTFEIPRDASRNSVVRMLDRLRRDREPSIRRIRGLGRLVSLLRRLAEPGRMFDVEIGREDFEFPGTKRLLELPPEPPDILHIHNLHGGYFDLRTLPRLSQRVPTLLNVRDGWLMSGHCAFSLGCERWKTGCGNCPDLTLYPGVKRDATAFNWRRKRSILVDSRLYIATPSHWMMDRVRESIVASSAVETRVIPNGVDTGTFFPGDRMAARDAIGMERDALILLIAANGLRHNVWKDYQTLRSALDGLGGLSWPKPLIVVAVGEEAPGEWIGTIEVRFVPFEKDSTRLADYYRAADVYLHAARVESFGNVLLESRACGTPIVATAVGGIPEQVRALGGDSTPSTVEAHDAGRATGVLVGPADPAAFAAAVKLLLDDGVLRERIAANGLQDIQKKFTLRLQAERFLNWYVEILSQADRSEVRRGLR